MSLSNAEKQRIYKQGMYEAGFKQLQVWVKREEPKEVKNDLDTFAKKMKKLTTGWSEEEFSTLLLYQAERIKRSRKLAIVT